MTPREGTLVANRYQLVRKVGGGPVAALWQVVHKETDSLGVLKLLSPAMHSHAEALTRFSLEERISRQLQGPYFAERLGSGSWEGVRYLVWKWHEGESLRTVIDRTERLDAPTVHSVIQQACTGLTLVHAQGYAHADLKPENLYFADAEPGEARQLKLFGFGIAARAPALKTGQTALGRRRLGQILGTPLYMSPELVLGHLPGDAQADLWALAVVTYEALTGRPPFLGANESEVFQAILNRDAPLPTSLASLPVEIDAWWLRAMSQEFHTPQQFSAELSNALRPALRSSHTQRSARDMIVPFAAAQKPIEGPQVAQPAARVDSHLAGFSRTVSGTGEYNPIAQALLALREQAKTEKASASNSAPPEKATAAAFAPVVPAPANFRIDPRKTLVGLRAVLLPPSEELAQPAKRKKTTEPGGTPAASEPSVASTLLGHGTPPEPQLSIQPYESVEVPRNPTVPIVDPRFGALGAPGARMGADIDSHGFGFSAQPERSEPESGGAPTVVMRRPDWVIPEALHRVAESRTFRALLPNNESRAQWVAAAVVCSVAALVMLVIGLNSRAGDIDLDGASLAAQPVPETISDENTSNSRNLISERSRPQRDRLPHWAPGNSAKGGNSTDSSHSADVNAMPESVDSAVFEAELRPTAPSLVAAPALGAPREPTARSTDSQRGASNRKGPAASARKSPKAAVSPPARSLPAKVLAERPKAAAVEEKAAAPAKKVPANKATAEGTPPPTTSAPISRPSKPAVIRKRRRPAPAATDDFDFGI